MLPERNKVREVASAIREARLAKGMTQARLAEKIGVPVGKVVDWESVGKVNFQTPNGVMYRKLNEVLFDKPVVEEKFIDDPIDDVLPLSPWAKFSNWLKSL